MVLPPRVELGIDDYKSPVLTIELQEDKKVKNLHTSMKGLEPIPALAATVNLTIFTLHYYTQVRICTLHDMQ